MSPARDALTEPAPGAPLDRGSLTSAMESANLPTLVVVLYQLTGDPRWLADPYRPTRGRGMDDNDDGGFAEPVRAEIRAAAVDAVLAWSAGRQPAVPAPTGTFLVELMSLAVGEPVPAEYEAMAAEDMGFRTPEPVRAVAPGTGFRVVVIGAGLSGMLAAIRLREAGIGCVVLEKNDDVGGTWLENGYPGAGVDTPSHLYSFSFAPKQWTTHFGKRDEVLAYLREVADRYDLRGMIRFGTEAAGAAYDARDAALDGTHHGRRGARSERRDHRGGCAQPSEGSRPARTRRLPRARSSTPPAGPPTSTSPASAWPSSGRGRARCRSCRRSPARPPTSRCSSAPRSGSHRTPSTSSPSPTASSF